jgi:tetratricopeptide (TPR) repeat protein
MVNLETVKLRIRQKIVSHPSIASMLATVFSGSVVAQRGKAAAFAAAGDYSVADQTLRAMIKKKPMAFEFRANYAHMAFMQGNIEEAIRRAREAVDAIPNLGLSHAVLISYLRKAGQYDEAQAVVSSNNAKFSHLPAFLAQRAGLASDKRDFATAVVEWEEFIRKFPENCDGPLGLAEALRETRELERADAVLIAARDQFSWHLLVWTHYASNADVGGKREEALTRWSEVVRRFPDEALSYAGQGGALRALHRFEEADRVFEEGIKRFPGDQNLMVNYAHTMDEKGDWDAAEQRWRMALERFPESTLVKMRLSESSMKARLARLEAEPAAKDASEENAEKKLFDGFESLGENCEFGFVQRNFGSEPLGLLRWAGISYDQLLTALDTDFAGVGDPEFTVLKLNANNHEYYTEDTRYYLSMHSFILQNDDRREQIYNQLCRRLRYLKDRLIEDLQSGDKIFVYQTAELLSDEALRRVHQSVCKHRPNRLLVMRAQDEGNPAGSIRAVDAGLTVGYLSKVGYDGKYWDIRFDEWLDICRRVVNQMPVIQ